MQLVYVVSMQRWGDEESHNYVLGAFSSEDEALEAGQVERSYRGCKYEPRVTECVIDSIDEDKRKYHESCK